MRIVVFSIDFNLNLSNTASYIYYYYYLFNNNNNNIATQPGCWKLRFEAGVPRAFTVTRYA